MEVKFTIPGDPVGKGRPRVTKWGAHTPEKTVLYENLIKLCYQDQCGKYTEKPLIAHIEIYYSVPKSTPKKNIEPMLNGEIRPCKKPDIDNICKTIFDALNGIAYKDDTQIVSLHATKFYARTPHVFVTFKEVADEKEE